MPRLDDFSVRPQDPFHPHARRRRAWTVLFAVAATLLFLASAFFRTQVLRTYDFVLRADDNRFRAEPIPAPRGTVYDRDGRIVAETVTGYTLLVEPGNPETVLARLEAAAELLQLDSATVADAVARSSASRGIPVVVVPSLSFEHVSRLQERRGTLTGLVLEPRPVRRYPAGAPVAHIVGYVHEIDERELQSREWEGYRQGQLIGKSGIERQYERTIGGTAGSYYVEVDARGRVVGRFAERLSTPPQAGGDVHLTLDLDLQRYAHQIFPEGMRGSIVAMVPGTGEILALYSAPTFDPNIFVGGVSARDWRRLNADPARPLLNRAIAGIYPPGSTWKLATAMVGLEKGVPPGQAMPLACSGGMSYAGRYSRCWKREGHGRQDMVAAIANSCNVYFYQLGIRIGLRDLTAQGTRLGFSRRTGVDLPGERPGTFPDGPDWYVNRFGWRPQPSEVMNISIGQGPNSQTPLRMAQFFSALAADGTARAPHLLAGRDVPVETDLGVTGRTLGSVREGLARVVDGGTAARSRLDRWKLYGKTGTSQNSEQPTLPHAWFTGFAGPRDGEPEIVVAVIVEFGESGSRTAAPLAAQIADFYLNKKYGFPNPELAEARPLRAGSTRG
jgi:penicillin-binding protein 2